VILEAQKILAQLFFIGLIGRWTVECRQLPQGPQIGLLCASAEPAKLQIARHPLMQAWSRKLGHASLVTQAGLRRPVHNARLR
jgi:hypothetical protein